ncbi:MAG: YidC/Oxa1 family membrane protein insertase [Clostridia bacterium]|nr:YidC/Oxa1 family membrane protein insertase [Clostridia bacterium]
MNILDIINIPFGYVIRFCSWLMGNQYLPALFLFAVIIEIVLLPFGIKQQKNSIKQAKLRPKEMAIRKKYAGRDDQPTKQKMTMEIQELYQKEGYNPMGGCLPLLIQLPIIYSLYAIVTQPLTYICRLSADAVNQVMQVAQSFFPSHAYSTTNHLTLLSDVRTIAAEHGLGAFSSVEGFSQNVTSLADLPDLSFFGVINLGQNPDITVFNWLLIVPVLTFVTYFISMKVNRKLTYQPAVQDQAMGCSNNMMDITMPLFSTFIAFSFPRSCWYLLDLQELARHAQTVHSLAPDAHSEVYG